MFCSFICLYVMCVLEMEMWMVVNHPVGAWNRTTLWVLQEQELLTVELSLQSLFMTFNSPPSTMMMIIMYY